jgi:hypothetical protein
VLKESLGRTGNVTLVEFEHQLHLLLAARLAFLTAMQLSSTFLEPGLLTGMADVDT